MNSPSTSVHDMGVDHRGAHVFVKEQFLYRSDVITIFQQIDGKKWRMVCGPAGFAVPCIFDALWGTDS